MSQLKVLTEKFGGFICEKNIDTNEFNRGGDMNVHGYSEFYEKLFYDIKHENVSLLEIGIFKGNGLAIWSKYFYNGKVYGLDIGTKSFENNKNFFKKIDDSVFNNLEKIYISDSSNTFEVEKLNLPQFDIIIDDGMHTLDSQYKTFCNFHKYLNHRGIYVIEDIVDCNLHELTENIKKHLDIHVEISSFLGNKNRHVLSIKK